MGQEPEGSGCSCWKLRACADCYFTYIKLSHFVICVLCQRLSKQTILRFVSLRLDQLLTSSGRTVKKSKRLHIIFVASVFDFLVCTPNIMWCLYWLSILYQIYRILTAFCFVVLSTSLTSVRCGATGRTPADRWDLGARVRGLYMRLTLGTRPFITGLLWIHWAISVYIFLSPLCTHQDFVPWPDVLDILCEPWGLHKQLFIWFIYLFILLVNLINMYLFRI